MEKKINIQPLGRTIAWRHTTATQMTITAQTLNVVGYRESCPICSCTSAEDYAYGQDCYEVMSMLTKQANQEIDIWPPEIFTAMNDVQKAFDRHNLSDSMLLISKRKQKN